MHNKHIHLDMNSPVLSAFVHTFKSMLTRHRNSSCRRKRTWKKWCEIQMGHMREVTLPCTGSGGGDGVRERMSGQKDRLKGGEYRGRERRKTGWEQGWVRKTPCIHQYSKEYDSYENEHFCHCLSIKLLFFSLPPSLLHLFHGKSDKLMEYKHKDIKNSM